ncbi:helix-turn-helix transcriptional regulator [Bradyrhizobium sp. BRP22]|nr:helix-turn-helix transcriptional regulator [Bradyrhizobium sp. BRP22]
MSLGQRISHCRNALGVSHKQFAERIGVSQQVVSDWVKDTYKPSKANLKRIAAACDCSWRWFVGGVGQPPPLRNKKALAKARAKVVAYCGAVEQRSS